MNRGSCSTRLMLAMLAVLVLLWILGEVAWNQFRQGARPTPKPPAEVVVTVAELGARQATLHVTATAPATLSLPLGERLTTAAPGLPELLLAAPVELTLDGQTPATVTVPILALTPFGFPLPEATWQRAGADADELTQRWLERCHVFETSWLARQAGLWAIRGSLSPEAWEALVSAPPYLTRPDLAERARREAEHRLQGLVDDPGVYALFADLVAAREMLLAELAPGQPVGTLVKALDRTAIRDFAGDPAVTEHLLALMTGHDDLLVRRLAFNQLSVLGMPGSAAMLRRELVAERRHWRLALIALTLDQRNETGAWPVLAALDRDPLLTMYTRTIVPKIQQTTGIGPVEGETLTSYWERAVGWEKLAWPDDQAALRDATERARHTTSAWLHHAIALLDAATEPPARLRLIGEIARYNRSALAFETLAPLTRDPAEVIRLQAVAALEGFVDFPVAPLYAERLQADGEAVAEAIMVIVGRDQLPGREQLVQAALRHSSTGIRARATRAIGVLALNDLVPTLLTLARDDPEAEVRQAARDALARLKHPALLDLLAGDLAADNLDVRRGAVKLLMAMGRDAKALALLARYADDSQLGSAIKPHLARQGYRHPPLEDGSQ